MPSYFLIVFRGDKGPEEEETKMEWGVGLVQKNQKEDERRRQEAEQNKPFMRTKDDEDLNNMLSSRGRWGDPMSGLVKDGPSNW
jgi:pre-mRNA-splicing factor CWC26